VVSEFGGTEIYILLTAICFFGLFQFGRWCRTSRILGHASVAALLVGMISGFDVTGFLGFAALCVISVATQLATSYRVGRARS
jgi:hypothetical protein